MTLSRILSALISALLLAGPSVAEVPLRPAPPAAVMSDVRGGGVEAFRLAIAACWNIGALSEKALAASVTLAARFDAQGRPEIDTIVLHSSERGDKAAVAELFENARRALLRCGHNGLPLPAALRSGDRTAHLTFDPAGERLR